MSGADMQQNSGTQLQNMRPAKRMKTGEPHAVTASAEFGFWGDLTQDLANDGFAFPNVADAGFNGFVPPNSAHDGFAPPNSAADPAAAGSSLPSMVVPRVSEAPEGGGAC